jgi:hypothetical protein
MSGNPSRRAKRGVPTGGNDRGAAGDNKDASNMPVGLADQLRTVPGQGFR